MKKILAICCLTGIMASCNNEAKREAAMRQARQAVIDSIATAEAIKQRTIDSMNALPKQERVIITKNDDPQSTSSSSGTTQKKGWSNTLKGAVIGAGAGAITGAMVDKKKGEGAVVGGLLGAGAGAGVGAIIDGKQKKKKSQQ